ncbi:hypothetical protein NM688_g2156 [Phlebia brevispora]|uniref:Uncharacterized protein n=1 Tax=Phlebia brevispora TaxID=194682 RepID=A0ACC1T9H0_9APHY|nr:hypothetical protein NM688_g2156 [Phlebia brevispora]
MALPFSIFVLSVEIVYMILTRFTTAELIAWSHISRYCRTLAIHEWRHRFRVLTAPFTCDMELFEVMLQEFHVYVTGSIALAFMNWRSFHTVHSDLDLYVPDTWADALKAYWVSLEEYRLVATKSFPHILHQYHLQTFMEFKNCCRTVHVITVIDSSSATSAVPSAWCTALMNVVTSTGFYSAYPKLTFAKKGIINGPYLDYDVADVPVTFYIMGTVSHARFFHSDGAPRHHVSLRIVPRDPEDLAAMRRYLRTYANPPIASVSAPSNTDILEAYKDMKIRLSIHGRAKIESFKDVYQGFNRYGCHWEMPVAAAETIEPGDLVIMECRMVRDDISGSNHTKWRTRLELMAIALALKHDWMEHMDGFQEDRMSTPLSEEV